MSEATDQKLDIAKLRQQAKTLNIPITRTMNASQIKGAIDNATNGPVQRIVSTIDTDAPPPGWARIEILPVNDPKASNADVYCQVNGYAVLIRRGVPVDVPIKILEGSLRVAKMKVLRENQNKAFDDPERFVFEEMYSYPFIVHAVTPGPDPRPVLEAVAAKRNAPRRRFWEENGYWPKPKELKDWLSNGGGRRNKE
jgi:hypothetical protein